MLNREVGCRELLRTAQNFQVQLDNSAQGSVVSVNFAREVISDALTQTEALIKQHAPGCLGRLVLEDQIIGVICALGNQCPLLNGALAAPGQLEN